MLARDGLRSLVAGVVGLIVIGSLTGCIATSHTNKESKMSPEESRLGIVQLYADTISALGTTGWEPIGAMSPIDCPLVGGGTGAYYPASQLGPASANPDADIAIVEALWKSKGITTTVKRSRNKLDTTIRLIGVGGLVDVVEFDADSARTSLDGNSVCVVGNAGAIIEKNAGN